MRRWSDGTLIQVPYVKPDKPAGGKPSVRNGFYCVETGESFPDAKSAAEYAGITAGNVYGSVHSGHKGGEYHWRRVREWELA